MKTEDSNPKVYVPMILSVITGCLQPIQYSSLPVMLKWAKFHRQYYFPCLADGSDRPFVYEETVWKCQAGCLTSSGGSWGCERISLRPADGPESASPSHENSWYPCHTPSGR